VPVEQSRSRTAPPPPQPQNCFLVCIEASTRRRASATSVKFRAPPRGSVGQTRDRRGDQRGADASTSLGMTQRPDPSTPLGMTTLPTSRSPRPPRLRVKSQSRSRASGAWMASCRGGCWPPRSRQSSTPPREPTATAPARYSLCCTMRPAPPYDSAASALSGSRASAYRERGSKISRPVQPANGPAKTNTCANRPSKYV
jgi:hypothetical protein